ncbi:hypothetical protein LI328DRAFT_172354 [Trichoderma asperelloides]|nr:hypothetical protein LI328DRAFT_172354 [Trichoderma asperelloides]
MRSSHRKSRNGCRECKQRHKKCDESSPTCLNCTITNRSCSYRLTRPSYRFSRPKAVPCVSTPSLRTLSPLTRCNTPEWQAQMYDLGHLELLHHFETGAFGASMLPLPISIRMVIMQCALTNPYLMDQILALSAAHMSTFRRGQQQLFSNKAMELQTRALSLFNRAETDITKQNSCSWFLYSSFLGLHIMFETFQCRNFESFFGKLSTYFPVHRGVHVVTRKAWPAIRDLIEEIVGQRRIEDTAGPDRERPEECGHLNSLIHKSDLQDIDKDACFQAIIILQHIFDLCQADSGAHIQIPFTISWPILVSARFGDMARRRIPEALVILSFYAVLLHRLRTFWVFGSSGRFLIQSISAYLGTQWEDWLLWPNHQLAAI